MDDEFEDLSQYSGDTVHDMWVDYDYNMNTGELSDYCDGGNLDEYINSDDDWDE